MTDTKLAERMREHLTCYCPDERCAELLAEVAALEARAERMERDLKSALEKLSRAPTGCDHGVDFGRECGQCEVEAGVSEFAFDEAASIPSLLAVLGAAGVSVERRAGAVCWAATNVRAVAAEARAERMKEALVHVEDILGFHEGSAAPKDGKGEPCVWINGEDHAETLAKVRAALAPAAEKAPEPTVPKRWHKDGSECPAGHRCGKATTHIPPERWNDAARPAPDPLLVRLTRFRSTTGALTGGNNHPDRCVCNRKETGQNADTPHTHYTEPPYSCARCDCRAYEPEVPPAPSSAAAGPGGAPERQRRGLYVASKTRHAAKWKALRAQGWPIISSWLDESEPGQTASFADLWARNVREVSSAAAVLLYVEPGETMKGALVEIGAALAHGVPVYGVGVPEGSTFREHPAFCDMGSKSLDETLECMRWLLGPVAAGPAEKAAADALTAEAQANGAEGSLEKAIAMLEANLLTRVVESDLERVLELLRTAQREQEETQAAAALAEAHGPAQFDADVEAQRERTALAADRDRLRAELAKAEGERDRLRSPVHLPAQMAELRAKLEGLRSMVHDFDQLGDASDMRFAEVENELIAILRLVPVQHDDQQGGKPEAAP